MSITRLHPINYEEKLLILQERILERKANTNAFKEEKKRQEKIKLNQRPNIQGSHML